MSLSPTVVVADCSEAFLMYLSILLNRLEFEALPVTSGTAAAKMVRAVRPNLLIIGAELAEADPLQLIAELREDETFSGLPIYFTSANETDEDAAMAAGATGFLAKPIGLDALHAALEQTRNFPGGQRRTPRIAFTRQVNLVWNGQDSRVPGGQPLRGGDLHPAALPLPPGLPARHSSAYGRRGHPAARRGGHLHEKPAQGPLHPPPRHGDPLSGPHPRKSSVACAD